jgi:hypothetical protein
MDWTPIIVQAIMTGGGVAIVWIKLHSVGKAVNGLSDKRVLEAKEHGVDEGVIKEKDAQQERRDSHSSDERRET